MLAFLLSGSPTDADSNAAPLAISLLALTATAALVATLFRRLKLEAIPGFLIAGFLVGPVLGIVRDAGSIEQITHLATILLMFGIGLQLEVDAIRRGMLPILAVGAVSTLVFLVGGTPVGLAFDNSLPQSIAINLAFAMSSTALLLRVLQERREVKATIGRLCIGVSIVQDLLSVVALALLPAIARWANASVTGAAADPAIPQSASPFLDILKSGAIGVGGITVLILAGRYVLPRAMHMVARTGSTELILVFSAATALAAAIGAAAVGFSPEMGAFLAGFMLATTPYKQQLTGQFAPIRDLLMPIFFTAVGLKVDPAALASGWGQVILGTIALLVVKSMLISVSAWALGASASLSILAGLYLAQAGEFSLVVLSQAADQGIINADSQARLIAIVILTLIISPMLVGPAHKLAHMAQRIRPAPWIHRSPLREGHDRTRANDPETPPVLTQPLALIAGFGPVGRDIAEKFKSKAWRTAIIELNPSTVHRQTELGRSILYGDVTNPEVLEAAGVEHASAFIITIPDHDSAIAATRLARAANPNLYIAVRAAYLSSAIQAREAGADDVTIEEVATATIMTRDVMNTIEKRGLGAAVGTNRDALEPAGLQ